MEDNEVSKYCSAKALELHIRMQMATEAKRLESPDNIKNDKTPDDLWVSFVRKSPCYPPRMTQYDIERLNAFVNYDNTLNGKFNNFREKVGKFMKSKSLF